MRQLFKLFWVLFFVIGATIPLLHMNTANITEQENRALAKFPVFRKNKKLNESYSKEFETWLGDRFWGRGLLINARFKTLYKINGKIENDKAFMNPSGYTYTKEYINILKQPIIEKDMSIIHKNLAYLSKWCDKNNIKLYLLVIPTLENLFLPDSEYIPSRPDLIEIYISELSDLPINIIYTKNLYENKKYDDYPFYHTDHHWTEFGAFLTYQVLAKEIKKDFKKFHVCSEDEFVPIYKEKVWSGRFEGFNRSYMSIHRGTGCRKLNLNQEDCKPKHSYKYYDHNTRKRLIVENGPLPMSKITHFNEVKNNLKMTLLGTSGNNFLMSFFPFSVHDVQMLRANNQEKSEKLSMERFEKHILDFKPNILVLSVRDSRFYRLKELYKNP